MENMEYVSYFLYLLATTMILVEVFIIPGFGLAGVLGIISLVAASLLITSNLGMALVYLTVSIIIIVLLMLILLRVLPTNKFIKKITLDTRQVNEEGYASTNSELNNLIGKKGKTASQLRPAGVALIDDKRVDVITEGGYIEPGKDIVVLNVVGSRVIVESIEQNNK